ncbi:hypothetical protein DFH06DRAFT_1131019 [Mycena polygramma]|nr:hypothetical protein DFH06DRAFT_1131019 [Mycena polygramma]
MSSPSTAIGAVTPPSPRHLQRHIIMTAPTHHCTNHLGESAGGRASGNYGERRIHPRATSSYMCGPREFSQSKGLRFTSKAGARRVGLDLGNHVTCVAARQKDR